PGQRRSLMRRALVGIVPDELLNRKRKAFAVRSATVGISSEWVRFVEVTQCMASSFLGIVDSNALREALKKARDGQQIPVVILMRTLAIESWLRNLQKGLFLSGAPTSEYESLPRVETANDKKRKGLLAAEQKASTFVSRFDPQGLNVGKHER